ncbi:MAG: hypothetical protein U9Q78_01235 [Chloroflexota bacterium]|nr:hypothetical protein [Chloroflexota bacterium]
MAEEKEFAFEDWLAEGIEGMGRRIRAERPCILPAEFHAHSRAARRECLLAVRSLMDAAIERLEESPQQQQQATRIEVE